MSNSPIHPPIYVPELSWRPIVEDTRQPSALRHKVEGAVAALAIIGGSLAPAQPLSDHSVGTRHASLSTPDEKKVGADFQKAISVDSCETKVSEDGAMDMYQRLFGADSAPSRDPSTLVLQTKNALTALDESRKPLDFAVFPAKAYKTLSEDALFAAPKLPLEQYRQVMRDYLAQLGVQALFNWDPHAPGAPDPQTILPVKNAATHTDDMLRHSVLDTLKGFSMIPQQLIAHAGVRRVVFGSIAGGSALGEVELGGGDIFIDTNLFKNDRSDDLADNEESMAVTPPHETTHLLHYNMCWQLLGKYVGDPAMRSLNDGVIYKDNLKNKDLVQKYSTFDDPEPGKLISVEEYGQTNELEDVATVSEVAFYGPNAQELYASDGDKSINMTPLREKFALLLARVENKDPQLADFYVNLLRAGRLQARVDAVATAGETTLKAILYNNPDLYKSARKKNLLRQFDDLSSSMVPYYRMEKTLNQKLNIADGDW